MSVVGTVVGVGETVDWTVSCSSEAVRQPENTRHKATQHMEREKNTLKCIHRFQNKQG